MESCSVQVLSNLIATKEQTRARMSNIFTQARVKLGPTIMLKHLIENWETSLKLQTHASGLEMEGFEHDGLQNMISTVGDI